MAAVSFSAGRNIDDKGGDKSSTKAYEDMVEIEKMLEGTTRGDPLAMDPGKKLGNLQPGILTCACFLGIYFGVGAACFSVIFLFWVLLLPVESIEGDGPSFQVKLSEFEQYSVFASELFTSLSGSRGQIFGLDS